MRGNNVVSTMPLPVNQPVNGDSFAACASTIYKVGPKVKQYLLAERGFGPRNKVNLSL